MSQKQTVMINGRHYDPVTGLAVMGDVLSHPSQTTPATPAVKEHHRVAHASALHAVTQKSQTLRRSALKRPQKQPVIHEIQRKKPVVAPVAAVKSAEVHKFAPRTTPQAANRPRMMDIAPVKHPHVAKIESVHAAKAAPALIKPAQVIKQEAIQNAVANTTKQTDLPKKRFRHPRVLSIVSASFALILLGGYLTYLNMPSLSVRVAAAAAGINASYPDYHPDGYSLHGPVAYNQGQVSMQFAANAGPQNFTIRQTKSSWDSAAVLDNYVTPKAGTSYITYSERGLTIYTFNGNAAWVNGGILYTIEGDAPLSSEQIRHIATSFM
jgi:hypothetical protein